MSKRSNTNGADVKRRVRKQASPPVVMTIGHSTRTIDEFISLLRTYEIEQVVDVRTIPRSLHNPQYEKDSLQNALAHAGIGYVHLPGLGGLRHSKPDSINMGWRNTSFRGFADYMQTAEFAQSLDELIEIAKQKRISIMCAEAVPWRCHRSLIGDALLVRGITVNDIMTPTHCTKHTLTSFANVHGTTITYPTEESHPLREQLSPKRPLPTKKMAGRKPASSPKPPKPLV